MNIPFKAGSLQKYVNNLKTMKLNLIYKQRDSSKWQSQVHDHRNDVQEDSLGRINYMGYQYIPSSEKNPLGVLMVKEPGQNGNCVTYPSVH